MSNVITGACHISRAFLASLGSPGTRSHQSGRPRVYFLLVLLVAKLVYEPKNIAHRTLLRPARPACRMYNIYIYVSTTTTPTTRLVGLELTSDYQECSKGKHSEPPTSTGRGKTKIQRIILDKPKNPLRPNHPLRPHHPHPSLLFVSCGAKLLDIVCASESNLGFAASRVWFLRRTEPKVP